MYVKLLVNRNRYFSTLTVPESFNITDVNATLNISHSHNSDLIAELVAPNGTRVKLFSRVGGATDNFTNTTFDDQANTSITNGSGPFSGSYRPESLLSVLNGIDAAGVWKLEITDMALQDSGTLHSWSLQFSYVVTPATFRCPYGDFAVGFDDSIKGRPWRAGDRSGVCRDRIRLAVGRDQGNWDNITPI